MSKLYYEAISKMPKRFIGDETTSTQWDRESVIIANPRYAPMIYTAKTGKWKTLKFKNALTKERSQC